MSLRIIITGLDVGIVPENKKKQEKYHSVVVRFAKITQIDYTQPMNDETHIPTIVTKEEDVPAIRDEEQFQDAIIKAKEKSENMQSHDRFMTLSDEIHSALARQDSDTTLTLITK